MQYENRNFLLKEKSRLRAICELRPCGTGSITDPWGAVYFISFQYGVNAILAIFYYAIEDYSYADYLYVAYGLNLCKYTEERRKCQKL